MLDILDLITFSTSAVYMSHSPDTLYSNIENVSIYNISLRVGDMLYSESVDVSLSKTISKNYTFGKNDVCFILDYNFPVMSPNCSKLHFSN